MSAIMWEALHQLTRAELDAAPCESCREITSSTGIRCVRLCVYHEGFDDGVGRTVEGVSMVQLRARYQRGDPPNPTEPHRVFDSDGYCVCCGNGHWQVHRPECELADMIDRARALLKEITK